jgi:hypothetical protein
MKILNHFYEKLIRRKDRRAFEKKAIKKLLELNEDKNIIINIEWAN